MSKKEQKKKIELPDIHIEPPKKVSWFTRILLISIILSFILPPLMQIFSH